MNFIKLFNKKTVIAMILSLFFYFANCSAFDVTDLLGYPLYQYEETIIERYEGNGVGAFSKMVPIMSIQKIGNEKFQIKTFSSIKSFFFLEKSYCDEFGDEFWSIKSPNYNLYGLLSVQKYSGKIIFINVELKINDKKRTLKYSTDTGRWRLLDQEGQQKLVMCSELSSDPSPIQVACIAIDKILNS